MDSFSFIDVAESLGKVEKKGVLVSFQGQGKKFEGEKEGKSLARFYCFLCFLNTVP